jgi:hypothetical protein
VLAAVRFTTTRTTAETGRYPAENRTSNFIMYLNIFKFGFALVDIMGSLCTLKFAWYGSELSCVCYLFLFSTIIQNQKTNKQTNSQRSYRCLLFCIAEVLFLTKHNLEKDVELNKAKGNQSDKRKSIYSNGLKISRIILPSFSKT